MARSQNKNKVDIKFWISAHDFPQELWQEVKIMALINRVRVGHVLALAVTDYLKKHNGKERT